MKHIVKFRDDDRLKMFALAQEAYEAWEQQPKLSMAKMAPKLWLNAYLKKQVGSFIASLFVALAIRLIIEAVIYWIKNRTAKSHLSTSFADFAAGVYEVES
jgi:hypothetical protein